MRDKREFLPIVLIGGGWENKGIEQSTMSATGNTSDLASASSATGPRRRRRSNYMIHYLFNC